MRLIDADELINDINNGMWDWDEVQNITGVTVLKQMISDIQNTKTVDVSEISDGYHTFADLYEQRLVLSASLAKNNQNAWKSKLHSDGTEPFGGGWFVMGWKTNEGQYTYHYELKDWDLFDCKEIPTAPEWDGHTSADVRRLLSMPTVDASPVVWHKVTTRPLTEEETAYYAEMEIECIEYIFDCEMPEDGKEILVATKWGVDKDICCNDMDYGTGLESRGDWDGVYAWAEMPKYEEAE